MSEQIIVREPCEDVVAVEFTSGELAVFEDMQTQYRLDHDLFSRLERARLQFIRWLYLSGRIEP